jgi:uncharacterized membrane protein YphA (DoxX/SURF4 family)
MSVIRAMAINAVIALAMVLAASLVLGWFPLWFAFILYVLMVGALLLGSWTGNKIANQRRR